MRGPVERQATMLFGVTTEDFIPADHPIRKIRRLVDGVLAELSGQLTALYAEGGRHSVPPEHLIKASLLMALYSIRSERQFCERLQYDLLFKWFLGLNISDRAFNHSTFSKNRQRFMAHGLAEGLLGEVVREARRRGLISEDHFSVDGTLLQAWASQKSVGPRDEQEPPSGGGAKNPEVDFHGQQRRNETHVSSTDPEARLAKKARGQEARLSFAGHLLTENRSGLILDVLITPATGTAERDAALQMLDRQRASRRRATLAADRGYDTRAFVEQLRQRQVTPHVAQNTSGNRRSAIDGRTTRHPGYQLSQRVRKRIEECFGWIKTVGGGRKLRYVGCVKNQLWATFTAVAYNLVRMANLEPQSA
jgi:transposase